MFRPFAKPNRRKDGAGIAFVAGTALLYGLLTWHPTPSPACSACEEVPAAPAAAPAEPAEPAAPRRVHAQGGRQAPGGEATEPSPSLPG